MKSLGSTQRFATITMSSVLCLKTAPRNHAHRCTKTSLKTNLPRWLEEAIVWNLCSPANSVTKGSGLCEAIRSSPGCEEAVLVRNECRGTESVLQEEMPQSSNTHRPLCPLRAALQRVVQEVVQLH